MISRCEREWEGCDRQEAVSGLKSQGRCWFGCDVVCQERAGSLMQFGGVAAGTCHTAPIPVKS